MTLRHPSGLVVALALLVVAATLAPAQSSVEELAARLDSSDARTRRDAARALGEDGSIEAVAALTPAARDADRDVRRAALEALAAVRRPDAVAGLILLLETRSPRIGAAPSGDSWTSTAVSLPPVERNARSTGCSAANRSLRSIRCARSKAGSRMPWPPGSLTRTRRTGDSPPRRSACCAPPRGRRRSRAPRPATRMTTCGGGPSSPWARSGPRKPETACSRWWRIRASEVRRPGVGADGLPPRDAGAGCCLRR